MGNLIRNIIFIGAIVFLIVMLLPIRPNLSGEKIIEIATSLAFPIIIVFVFVLQIMAKVKKKGGNWGNWQEILKAEIKKIENQANYNKKK